MSFVLSILDKSPIAENETAAQALQHTLELVQAAERLGYHRFWVSEHHDMDSFACPSPEVLIAYLLARTEHIRIGSGGVMLQHYSPYKVAENFNLLSCLAPGRVDLGIGRAPGGFPRSTRALQPVPSETVIPLVDKLVLLDQLVHDEYRTDQADPLYGLRAKPSPPQSPELYLLGASVASAEIAAKLGMPYVFSQWISGDDEVQTQALAAYRSMFQPSRLPDTHVIMAVSVIVADTDEEAERQAEEFKVIKIFLENGKKLRVGSLELLNEFTRQTSEKYTIEQKNTIIIYGSHLTVFEKLKQLYFKYEFDELMINIELKTLSQRLDALREIRLGLSELVRS
ncbi:LLM class flavin-dependent oxidoreductase [Paenibacillus periandrae]|uniref:LLM class flavin-dependent oxidoreductase n=1 Tax=Paenibacillus periandrae TaxID=1761741 RepID=UPI001F0928B6|nr:LLM class flavin-dependent oxidoreductase [Paenibacillus periandrae]